ncbi:MAG: DUF2799 domain-containing protein [Ruminobacter sp.]|jgi:hypothetical protein|nr:DUF2799 domain-containing protein [Ruminobacter sp.]
MGKLLNSVAAGLIITLSGCAIMSEEECYEANWGNVGYQDGVNGHASSRFNEYVSACAKYVNVDKAAYDAGRKQGADVFCTNDRAYQMGSANEGVTDICSISSNYHNFKTYYTRGINVYNECKPLYDTDDYIKSIDEYISDGRLGPLHHMLRADRDYLVTNRGTLANHCNYVQSRGYEGNFNHVDYSHVVSYMPYPYALEGAANAEKMFEDVDRAYREIDRRIEDANRCESRAADDENWHERDRCRNKARCLYHARDKLRDNERRAVHDFSRSSSGSHYHHWVDDYKNCR